MKRRALLLATLLGLAVLGCETTERRRPKPAEITPVRRASPTRAWQVVHAGEVVGSVVYFAAVGSPALSVYVVRNTWQQDLGWIDGLGRAYRLLPHHRDPAWAGTGTIAVGTARILELDECELIESALPEIVGPDAADDAADDGDEQGPDSQAR